MIHSLVVFVYRTFIFLIALVLLIIRLLQLWYIMDLDQTSETSTEGEQTIQDFCTNKKDTLETISSTSNEQTVQIMADQETNGNVAADNPPPAGQDDANVQEVERPKKNQTPAEPPVTFREFNVSTKLTKNI